MDKSLKDIKELKNPYFDLQAELGITKHMGGLKATDEYFILNSFDFLIQNKYTNRKY